MEQLFKAILAIAEENPDGFTVDLTTLKKITKGISVAYLETQDSFGEEGLKRVLNHALVHEKKIGGWLNEENGMFYFDSIRIFTNLEEAKRFGRENNQIAIFDISHLRLIKL
jgi:fructokinase